MSETRVESDSFGPISVPAAAYWGAQTQRSIRYFPFGQAMPLALLHAFGALKAAPLRIAALDLPVPFAPELERVYRPSVESVIDRVAAWLG